MVYKIPTIPDLMVQRHIAEKILVGHDLFDSPDASADAKWLVMRRLEQVAKMRSGHQNNSTAGQNPGKAGEVGIRGGHNTDFLYLGRSIHLLSSAGGL